MQTRVLEIRKSVLNKNDELARKLRARFQEAGVLVLNLVSSPGAGKTQFLQKVLTELHRQGARVAALVGDLETDNDARRLMASGAPVRQIMTHGCCHLDASMIETHLDGWALEELEILFIENVGNLVCPSNYDLGEAIRVALLSVTEGGRQAAQVSRNVQQRRCRHCHQDGPGGGLRVRPGCCDRQPQRGSPGNENLRDFSEDRARILGMDDLPERPWPTAHKPT